MAGSYSTTALSALFDQFEGNQSARYDLASSFSLAVAGRNVQQRDLDSLDPFLGAEHGFDRSDTRAACHACRARCVRTHRAQAVSLGRLSTDKARGERTLYSKVGSVVYDAIVVVC